MNETPPTIETDEEYDEYHGKCVEKYLPGLLVTTIPYRKYARVEFDFILVNGWRLLEREDGSHRELSATLSDEAVEEVREIVSEYEDSEPPSTTNHSWAIGDSPGFYSTPKMDSDAAEELAKELKPVVHDRSNWVLYPKNNNFDEDRIIVPEGLRDQ